VCEGSRFVLSFPTKESARIDGPVDSCSLGEVRYDGGNIIVQVDATPQFEGSRWTWSVASGFGPEEKVAFVAAGGGWLALRGRSIDHPSKIFNFADLSRLIDENIGMKRPAILRISSGPGL
jgi:hypothetical protein